MRQARFVYQPSDGQCAPVLLVPLPWRTRGYRAYLVIVLVDGWRIWRWGWGHV